MKQKRFLVGITLLAALMFVCFTPSLAEAKRRRVRQVNQGCWVRIWKDHNHGGWYQLIRGPRRLPNMRLSGRDWGDRISGLATGPRTWVKIFKDQGLHGGVMIVPPNTSYRSLEDVGFDDAIDSMIIQNRPFR